MSTRKKPWHNVRVLDAKALARWPIPDHDNDADKEGRGHVLVVAGSEEVPGAALLAAVAALRAGAGKLTVAAPRSVSLGLALAIPEARVIALDHGKNSAPQARAITSLEPLADSVDAVVIGPGMLEEQRSMPFVRAALALFAKSTVVLDAVAMSVAKDTVFSQPVVLTPHAGEMAHLLGNSKDDVCANAESTAIEAACRWNACVALKGSSTVIAMPSAECWRFTGGSVGLATSGSGDTLAGVIGGLAARGMPPIAACGWGVTLHARAGAALARRSGPLGYLARELAGELPMLIKTASKFRV